MLCPRSLVRSFATHPSPPVPSPVHHALTLLHRLTTLLPSIPTASSWDSLVSRVHNDLSASQDRPIKLALFGLDNCSTSKDLVVALLSDPLSSDETLTRALHDRWKHVRSPSLTLSWGPQLEPGPSSYKVPSPFFSHFTVPVELVESSISSSNILENSLVYDADVSIFVCNPLVTPPGSIPANRLPSNSLFLFSTCTTPDDLQHVLSPGFRPSLSRPEFGLQPSQCIFVDPRRATEAIRVLQDDSTSVLAVQRFQDHFIASNVSSITTLLRNQLSLADAQHGSQSVRNKLAIERLEDLFRFSNDSLISEKGALKQTFDEASNLQQQVEEVCAKVEGSAFSRTEDGTGGHPKTHTNEVKHANEQADKEMQRVLDHLTWWRILLRADEISSTVSQAVTSTWCRDLEQKIILQTGKLAAIQEDTSKRGFDLLSRHPHHPTAVLRNRLEQLKSAPEYQLKLTTLTEPIHRRKHQTAFPTTRLHIAGQKAVLGMFGGVVSGAGISWVGWLQHLAQDTLYIALEANTLMGSGLLLALGAIRWGAGRWERAKGQWLQDWRRVGDGLERDLKTTLNQVMEQKVTVVASTASQGMLESLQNREEELTGLQEKVEALKAAPQSKS